MSTLKKLLYGCLILVGQSCNSLSNEEKPGGTQDVDVISAELLRQEAMMDSIIIAEETEFAQQVVIKQQLMELKFKAADRRKDRSAKDGSSPGK